MSLMARAMESATSRAIAADSALLVAAALLALGSCHAHSRSSAAPGGSRSGSRIGATKADAAPPNARTRLLHRWDDQCLISAHPHLPSPTSALSEDERRLKLGDAPRDSKCGFENARGAEMSVTV